MEVDYVYSVIQRELKRYQCTIFRIIFRLESQLTIHFFKNFSRVAYYNGFRPGRQAADPQVNDIVGLKYLTDGVIKYKLDFEDWWTSLPRRPRHGEYQDTIVPGHKCQTGITGHKYKYLQELKCVNPKHYHSFYEELKVKSDKPSGGVGFDLKGD